ncbi:hypothetical protein ZOSMA_25G00040 [Zostera marina]|uniref:Transducin/WD40 repeat-like superfamily protein n=1 Tax=Zostera marina TaxID=29655 RepID=A0A0K9PFB7_ZOSMR|nr:hypothetical protein ZOSMA_25G00040 [Zostera marina]
MVEVKSFRKATIPTNLLSNPSPGNIQSTRLDLHVSGDGSTCSVYIASGSRVYKIEIFMEDLMVSQGKDNLLIPIPAQIKHSSMLDRCPHRSEIKSVVLAAGEGETRLILGTVDSFGHLIVSQLETNGEDAGDDSDIDSLSYSVLPHECGVGEGSWAGVCFSPRHWSTAAVVHSFGKTINVYDQDILFRNLHTLWYPHCLSFFQSSVLGGDGSSVLAVGEGSQLSIWDLRTKENGGCVQRICGSIGDNIYAVSCSPSGPIAIGGSNRTVTIYDPRRWRSLSRWVHCCKYEVTNLSFSSIDPNFIYIQGVDYEVICGQWKNKEKTFSFKGDSNWVGFSKCGQQRDVVGGWCDSGSIFIAEVLNKWDGEDCSGKNK